MRRSFVPACLTAGLLVAMPSVTQPAVAAPQAAAATTTTTSVSASVSAGQAAQQASATGNRVKVPGMTSQTTETFANPDGSFTDEIAVEPVRVNRAGAWLPVDSTLQANLDGSWSPKVS